MQTGNKDKEMKICVIDVGGGLRGIYAAGVFDYCIDNDIAFDIGIGISAGSANLASYMAKQKGRNYKFFHDYSTRKEYMGWGNFIFKHSFLDLDYIYGTLSNRGGENPLDYDAMSRNPIEWYMVATNALTGEAHYFSRNDIREDDYSILKASSSIPFVCTPRFIAGIPYYDGALGNPVPIEKAFELGADRAVLILTKPLDTIRSADKDIKIARLIRRKYPNAAKALENRARNYNNSIDLARKYQEEGKVLIIAPDDTCGVSTLTRDKNALDMLYRKGYDNAKAISLFLKNLQ